MPHTRSLPPGEKRVLVVVGLHLCFLPWALGTMHVWSQVTSLGLSLCSFLLALCSGSQVSGSPVLRPPSSVVRDQPLSRLVRFPPFWLGLGLLLYLLLQAFNPSWRYATDGSSWWLTAAPNHAWLPTSIETPFARFNIWRQFIIYSSAWLTLCAVGIGLTRRRSLGMLLTVLAANGFVLVLVGFFFRFTQSAERVLWFEQVRPEVITFASFIYKNHAGAYLGLVAAVMVMLAARYYERALREHARSSPAMLYVLGSLVVFFGLVFTYSRAGTVLLAAYLLAAGLVFGLHRYFSRTSSTTPRVVTFTVLSLALFVLVFALAQLDFGRVLARFERLADPERKDVSVYQRLEVNAASLDLLADRWPRGIGAGGFRYVFPQYIGRFDASYQGGRLYWEHTHNDWLELPIELGLAGVTLIGAGGLWWLAALGRGRLWRRLPALLLALGLWQTLAHAAVDFPFQNPAILVTWLVLAVVAVRYGENGKAEELNS
jgi:hypothetical protein